MINIRSSIPTLLSPVISYLSVPKALTTSTRSRMSVVPSLLMSVLYSRGQSCVVLLYWPILQVIQKVSFADIFEQYESPDGKGISQLSMV